MTLEKMINNKNSGSCGSVGNNNNNDCNNTTGAISECINIANQNTNMIKKKNNGNSNKGGSNGEHFEHIANSNGNISNTNNGNNYYLTNKSGAVSENQFSNTNNNSNGNDNIKYHHSSVINNRTGNKGIGGGGNIYHHTNPNHHHHKNHYQSSSSSSSSTTSCSVTTNNNKQTNINQISSNIGSDNNQIMAFNNNHYNHLHNAQILHNHSNSNTTNNNNNTNNNPNGNILCDISNLTAEEKEKLDEIRNKRNKLLHDIQKIKEAISIVKKEMNKTEHSHSTDTNNGSGCTGITKNEQTNAQRTKQMSIGKKKFNMDPKKGIEYLIMNNLINNNPRDVAEFFFKGDGLNKTAIGTYLGEKIDFNLKVLNCFIELHDFKNLLLVQALRQFLWSFRLPGEAQKIDRMMEKFAAHYCQQNPGVFSNTDTCFVLSFSIIMLNTSLHNPNVKDKMTSEKFIVMNRGINNGGDLPRELLISLYDDIRQEAFKIPEDDGNNLMQTFFNPDREGWLWKQGGRYKTWKRRWFILNDKCLYYFECATDKEPRGIIPLENVDIREISDRGGRQHCFELYSAISDVIKACKTDTEGRVIEGRHSVYRLSAATNEEKDAWVKSIQTSVSRNPFYEMLAARKRKAQQN